MSKIEKLIILLKRLPPSANYAKVKTLLEHNGYQLNSIRGSHFKFKKTNAVPINFPVHKNRVKKVYLKDILRILKL